MSTPIEQAEQLLGLMMELRDLESEHGPSADVAALAREHLVGVVADAIVAYVHPEVIHRLSVGVGAVVTFCDWNTKVRAVGAPREIEHHTGELEVPAFMRS